LRKILKACQLNRPDPDPIFSLTIVSDIFRVGRNQVLFYQKRREEERIMFKEKRTAMVGSLVVALFLSLLTFMTPGKALAAYDCFICLDNIRTDDIFRQQAGGPGLCPDAIPIVSWSFGEIYPTSTTTTGSARVAGRVQMQDLKFSMRTNKASVTLFQDCATGTPIRSAVLIARGVFANQQVQFLKITLTDVLVTSFVNIGNSGSTQAYPIEEVSLNFGKIQIEYVEIGSDGKPKAPVRGGYDVKAGTKM
jgi:type VI secretion system secreted protein Hcp